MRPIEVIKVAANKNNTQTQSTHTIESKNHLTSQSHHSCNIFRNLMIRFRHEGPLLDVPVSYHILCRDDNELQNRAVFIT